MNGPFRTCAGACKITFLAVSCQKCFEPLYMDDYFVGVAREEECPSCSAEVDFYLCSCGMLTMDKKCVKASCKPPSKVISYSKQWKEEQKKKKEEE